jgi:hypothetical protein
MRLLTVVTVDMISIGSGQMGHSEGCGSVG